MFPLHITVHRAEQEKRYKLTGHHNIFLIELIYNIILASGVRYNDVTFKYLTK